MFTSMPLIAIEAVRLPPLPRLEVLALLTGSGVEIMSDVAISLITCSLAASHPGVPAFAAIAALALMRLSISSVWAEN